MPRLLRCLAVIVALTLTFTACADAKHAPASAEDVKTAIVNAGMNLSFSEEAELLDEMVSAFSFKCEGRLDCYLTAKDVTTDEVLLEVMCFELAVDAETAASRMRTLSAGKSVGISGSIIWYGSDAAVAAFLQECPEL